MLTIYLMTSISLTNTDEDHFTTCLRTLESAHRDSTVSFKNRIADLQALVAQQADTIRNLQSENDKLRQPKSQIKTLEKKPKVQKSASTVRLPVKTHLTQKSLFKQIDKKTVEKYLNEKPFTSQQSSPVKVTRVSPEKEYGTNSIMQSKMRVYRSVS